jgi:hypothetical protein
MIGLLAKNEPVLLIGNHKYIAPFQALCTYNRLFKKRLFEMYEFYDFAQTKNG